MVHPGKNRPSLGRGLKAASHKLAVASTLAIQSNDQKLWQGLKDAVDAEESMVKKDAQGQYQLMLLVEEGGCNHGS